MRPNRIIIGEVREAGSLDMLVVLNAGVPVWPKHPSYSAGRQARRAGLRCVGGSRLAPRGRGLSRRGK
jgi:hypothetical protein